MGKEARVIEELKLPLIGPRKNDFCRRIDI